MEVLTRQLSLYDKPDIDFVLYTMFFAGLKFSQAEIEVLKLVMRGLNNKDMAEQKHVCVKTIKFHLTNIFKKLNVRTRAQAVVRISMVINSRIPVGG